jgi:hypothetical protein
MRSQASTNCAGHGTCFPDRGSSIASVPRGEDGVAEGLSRRPAHTSDALRFERIHPRPHQVPACWRRAGIFTTTYSGTAGLEACSLQRRIPRACRWLTLFGTRKGSPPPVMSRRGVLKAPQRESG